MASQDNSVGQTGRQSEISLRCEGVEDHFKPSLPFVLSDYLTAEERSKERLRRNFERSIRLASSSEKKESPRLGQSGHLQPEAFLAPPSIAPSHASTGYHTARTSYRNSEGQSGDLRSSYESASTFFEEEPQVINYKKFKVLSMDEETRLKEEEVRKERNLQTLDDLEKLKKYYYQEYMEALRSKIDKQRQTIKRKEEVLTKKILKREEKKIEDNKTNRRSRLQTFSRNGSFLRKIPKSHYYLIIGLEEQLRQQGKLKTQSDYDEFWDTIQRPEIYSAFFKDLDQNRETPSLTIPSLLDDASTQKARGKFGLLQNFQPMVQIQESTVEDDEITEGIGDELSLKPSSARKSLTSPKTGSQSPTTPSLPRRGSIGSFARAAAAALDQKYPKMELPALACFSLDLGEQEKDPYEERLRQSIKKKSEGRKLFQKRVRTMFELAQTNAASTRRILANHDEVRKLGEGPTVRELSRWLNWLSDPRKECPTSEEEDEYNTLTSLRSATAIDDRTEKTIDDDDDPDRLGLVFDRDDYSNSKKSDSGESGLQLSTGRTKQSSGILSDEAPPEQNSQGSRSSRHSSLRSLKKTASRPSREGGRRRTPGVGKGDDDEGIGDRKSSSPITSPSVQVPLRMEEVASACDTKEAKSVSTLWNNPAGRRVWNELKVGD